MARINLDTTEKLNYFYNALCNGLGYVQNSYGLELTYDDDQYDKSRQNLVEIRPNGDEEICYEDVLMQILYDGGQLTLVDNENGEDDAVIDKDKLLENLEHVPFDRALQMVNQEDDADTADVFIQTGFYGKVIFG